MSHKFLPKGFNKLVVCSGVGARECEAIDLESSTTTCQNAPNFPVTVIEAIGGLQFKENPIICGGSDYFDYFTTCYTLENKKWVSSPSMNSVRYEAAAAQLQDGRLFVTGGIDNSGYFLNSAEMLTEEGWANNITPLPVTIADHCMVTVNSTTVMAIGGWQQGQESGKTFFFTFERESWMEGPELKHARHGHSCGQVRRNKENQDRSIIVVGGYDGYDMTSVEILDEGSNEWRKGPELPVGICLSQMVENQNGGVVLVGGSNGYIGTLYQLPHGGHDAVWTKMAQKLKTGRNDQTAETGRRQHTAFLVADNLVDCFEI
jgi:hypothetical protein